MRYLSGTQGDTLSFTLANASAFVLSGFTRPNRRAIQVAVTPPAEEGPVRIYRLNDSIPQDFQLHVIHHFETGLNGSSNYSVTLTNPMDSNNLDLRYLQILEAAPPPPPRYA